MNDHLPSDLTAQIPLALQTDIGTIYGLGIGIQPTILVTPTLQGIREGRDEQLARAIEALRQDG